MGFRLATGWLALLLSVVPQVAQGSAADRVVGLEVFQPLQLEFMKPIPVPRGAPGKSITFRKVVLDMRLDDVAGNYGFGLFCAFWRREISLEYLQSLNDWYSPENYKQIFRSEFESSGFRLTNDSDDLFENDDGGTSDFLLAGRIVKVFVNVCSGNDEDGRTVWGVAGASIAVEWELYSNNQRRVVHKVVTNGVRDGTAGGTRAISVFLQDAFKEASRNLTADREFYRLVYGEVLDEREERMFPIGLVGMEFDSDEKFDRRKTAKSLVSVETEYGKSEGFVLSSEGYILTSADVVAGSTTAKVTIGTSRKKVAAIVLRADPLADVALLRLAEVTEPLLPLPLRRQEAEVGEDVQVVVGRRSSRSSRTSRSVRSGTILGVLNEEGGHKVLISDVDVNDEIQGTPLLDGQGNVLGLKIRDFVGETSEDKAGRFLSIHDALNALAILAMK